MQVLWENRYSHRIQRVKSSAIRELLKLSEQPDIISFGGGLPAPEVFPVEAFRIACEKVLREMPEKALQYGSTEGFLPLRELIVEDAAKYGLEITPDNVLITSGSQQALDMLGKLFINRGDNIVVENPTYLGALQAMNAYGAEYVSIPMDDDGMIIEELEKVLRCAPKMIYVLPNFQNPTGVTLSFERRQRLVEVADRWGVPMIEDDPYGRLRFEGKSICPVQSIDAEMFPSVGCYNGSVIYLSTYSKLLAPGFRLAWVIAPKEVIRKMVMIKQGADLHTSTFNQIVAYEVAKDGFLQKHIETIRDVYRERRNVMLETLEEHMPEGVHWTHPDGGLFLWITTPEHVDTVELFKDAIKEKVSYVPGESFFPNGGGKNAMRINFSYCTPERINEGISRLGKVLHKWVKA